MMDAVFQALAGIGIESWRVLAESAPFMLLGFFFAGLIKGFVPDGFVARTLGRRSAGSVLRASLFGVPLPLCSCSVLPTARGLRKQGASKGAVTAFLISTPETGGGLHCRDLRAPRSLHGRGPARGRVPDRHLCRAVGGSPG